MLCPFCHRAAVFLSKMFTFVLLCWHLESPRSASTSGPESCRSWGVPLSWSRLPEGDCPGWRTCKQPSGMSLNTNFRRIILLHSQNKATWINKTQLKGKNLPWSVTRESDSGPYPKTCAVIPLGVPLYFRFQTKFSSLKINRSLVKRGWREGKC